MNLLPNFLQSQELSALAVDSGVVCAFAADSWYRCWTINDGVARTGGVPEFTLRGPDEAWHKLLSPQPQPGWQSVLHLITSGCLSLVGDSAVFDRNIHLVRAVIEALREPESGSFSPSRRLTARGEYHRVRSALGTADVHVERCGRGQPIVALATAGSPSTLWHGLMTESDITERYELITVDLPWHGSSSPTFGTAIGEWRLTPGSYAQFIADAVRTIGASSPILLGASMAGAAVIHAVAVFPALFTGAVSCQAGRHVRNRLTNQLNAPDIDQSRFVPEWIYGLMNPSSPAEFRKRVWWGYSSGGHGLYVSDIRSYQQWDIDDVLHLLNASSPHIAVLSGEFDTTVPTSASESLANLIPNSSFQVMPDLGHFPHAENPARFSDYLKPALERVQSRRSPTRKVGASAPLPPDETTCQRRQRSNTN